MSTLSRIALTAALTVAILPAAQANSLTEMGNKASSMLSGQSAGAETSSGQGSAASLLSSLGSGNFNFASPQNVAGVLGYCQSQGYSKSATDTVKDKLMNRFGLQSTENTDTSESYQQGLAGLLKGENGQAFSLSSIKGKLGKKACGMVTDQAASRLLGM
ncbi:DUF2501 domain-containing protein [Larsenimonas rhizosphaerae]|uniref:DUF2501 domain-containing protein n=1 Tax=Larsenimonas rhizosphaerae TaxID=2944682 RepID=A0AA41ZLQ8_9GAMM|nr:DUF2501 domain-containing protein [Larsenimonas rhizosphaerae]MCX2524456.1 DUF2501 domain-containing protein [Larsenimonas rhizosphaerae]